MKYTEETTKQSTRTKEERERTGESKQETNKMKERKRERRGPPPPFVSIISSRPAIHATVDCEKRGTVKRKCVS